MSQPVVRVRQFTVSYDSLSALDGVDFECRRGEFVCIVGKSGSGKSSFLNALAGFVPFKGFVEIPQNIGYVFQDHVVFPWMTVGGNIGFGLSRMSRREKREIVQEILKRIDMEGFATRYPNTLSGGQAQRVALARVLATDPDVILMDEPYAALDHYTRDRMQDWLLTVWGDSRKTILFVTHYIEEAVFLADRIVVIRDRRFVADVSIPFQRPRKSGIRFSERFAELKHRVLGWMGSDIQT